MGRKIRVHFPQAMYHVMLRGNNRQNIFLEDSDYQQFITFLEKSVEEFSYKIHAYCLMRNHVHLAIEVNDIPLSKIIQNIAQRYAYWFNHRYKCIGHLFHGRYKAILIQNKRYALGLCKYIHLNPVRVKIVKNLENYYWSSHLSYLDKINIPWVSTDLVFSLLQPKEKNAVNNHKKIAAYRNFISKFDSDHDDFRSFLEITSNVKIICVDPLILRRNNVVNKAITKPIGLSIIIEVVCRNLSLNETSIFTNDQNWQSSEARAIIALCVKEFGEIGLTELSILYNRDIATLCNAIKRLKDRQSIKPLLAEKLVKIKKELGRNS